MKLPNKIKNNVANAAPNVRGLHIGNCAGRLKQGEKRLNSKGSTSPVSLGYFIITPSLGYEIPLNPENVWFYQRKTYSVFTKKDFDLTLTAIPEAHEARKNFFFQIKDLEQDFTCFSELRVGSSNALVCQEVTNSKLPIGGYYNLVTELKFDDNGRIVDGQKLSSQQMQKVAFSWVEEIYGTNKNVSPEQAHIDFQAAIQKKHNGEFKAKLQIKAYLLIPPDEITLKDAYVSFETTGEKSSILGIAKTIQNLEQYKQFIEQAGNEFDLKSIFFRLQTKTVQSEVYGSGKKYPVVELVFYDANAKNYRFNGNDSYSNLNVFNNLLLH